jgi:hypothetical protein
MKAWRIVLVGALFLAGVCRADSDYSTYAFDNLFVFDTLAANGPRTLNVVSLDDDSRLKVIAQVEMPGRSAYISAYSHFGDKLLVLLRNRLEVYDLSNPAKPAFVKKFELKEQGPGLSGYPRVAMMGSGRFIVFNPPTSVSELLVGAQVGDWQMSPMALTRELKTKMEARPEIFDFETQAKPLLVIKETSKFRYQLIWKDKHQPGSINHHKYLQKVDKANDRIVGVLPLGTFLETID